MAYLSVDNTLTEARHAATISTLPTTVPAEYLDGSRTAATATCHQLPSPISEALPPSANRTQRLAPARERRDHLLIQNLSPRHKKRQAKTLEILTQQPLYHSLAPADR